MALFDDLRRRPGSPTFSQVAGAPPVPSRPGGIQPPSPATSPQGRPPSPPAFPAWGTGPALPVTPGTPPVAGPPAPPPSALRNPARIPPRQPVLQPQVPSPPPGIPPQPGPVPGAAPPGNQLAGGQEMVLQTQHVPTAAEMAMLPAGVRIRTPYGDMGPDGRLALSPEGAEKYRVAVVAKRRRFGPHPFAGDPNAPQPPIALGRSSINPFTGQWVGD